MGISGEKVGMEGNDCNETMVPISHDRVLGREGSERAQSCDDGDS